MAVIRGILHGPRYASSNRRSEQNTLMRLPSGFVTVVLLAVPRVDHSASHVRKTLEGQTEIIMAPVRKKLCVCVWGGEQRKKISNNNALMRMETQKAKNLEHTVS